MGTSKIPSACLLSWEEQNIQKVSIGAHAHPLYCYCLCVRLCNGGSGEHRDTSERQKLKILACVNLNKPWLMAGEPFSMLSQKHGCASL